MKIIRIAPLVLLMAVSGLQADFSYDQKTEMTGGVMQAAMKMAGKFSKQARQPMDMKTALKGRRMVSIMQDQRTITDLDAKTITTVNLKKKEYSVVTFEQMRQYMEKMAEKMKKKDANVNFTVSVEKTDNEKMIEGMPAKEVRLKMKIQGQNPQTGDSGQMDMLMQSWMTDPVRGYSQIREFYEEYGKELNWAPGNMGMFSMTGQGSQQGMAEMQEELAKMNGMPIMQVVSMGSGDLTQPAASGGGGGGQGGESAEETPDPIAGLKKGLGGLGGFGGFGKKKKKKEPKQEEQPQAASTQSAPAGNSGKLMEMTITYSNYSSAPVDAALVDTAPAGFKLVKSDIEKALR